VPKKLVNVETVGWATPVGQIVKNANAPGPLTAPGKVAPGATTVTLREYACATDGIEHVVLDCIGMVRGVALARLGGPNAPGNPDPARVSTRRHGVIATKSCAPAGA